MWERAALLLMLGHGRRFPLLLLSPWNLWSWDRILLRSRLSEPGVETLSGLPPFTMKLTG
eukprot:3282441-Amphidinium_carterae.1